MSVSDSCQRIFLTKIVYSPGADGKNTVDLDPADVIGVLPPELLALGDDLRVLIYDSTNLLHFGLQAFLSKVYRITDGSIRIGGKSFILSQMHIHVGYDIKCQNTEDLGPQQLG